MILAWVGSIQALWPSPVPGVPKVVQAVPTLQAAPIALLRPSCRRAKRTRRSRSPEEWAIVVPVIEGMNVQPTASKPAILFKRRFDEMF
jgi:hypothetical protein